ncbi:MAG: NAD(P)/FAD-dependent oxidoreductase [Geodermatophilaceae bacterium]|nr:NAD(P)/FAD-dependent oxidoreductase [Geodermatophilaceae bacterium]
MKRPHILIVGGGYVGLYTALRLQERLSRGAATITVVDPQAHMTYQPFLPEAAAGSVEPRHVVVPLRRTLKHCRVVTGSVTSVDHAAKFATVLSYEGQPERIDYDVLVMAPGSVARTLPIPGLAEVGVGFKTIGEAIYLRNQVLSRLDVAASLTGDDPATDAQRRCALTFTFIGGGYAGIEALAELEDMARYACRRYYRNLDPGLMRWVLVEATGRILPEVGIEMGAYTVRQLVSRGMDVRLNTKVVSMVGGHVVLSDGEEYDCDTIVWTAGVKANPLLTHTDLPLDDKGRLVCTADLQVSGRPDAWGAGDCAAVPDLTAKEAGAMCGPSAQHAVRQARRLGDNIAEVLRGGTPSAYRHRYVGSVASLGLYKGVAQVYGIKLKGFPAWFMHRTYHMSRVPTFNRKVRVLADWTLAFLFRRDVISLGQLQHPREEFREAAR